MELDNNRDSSKSINDNLRKWYYIMHSQVIVRTTNDVINGRLQVLVADPAVAGIISAEGNREGKS